MTLKKGCNNLPHMTENQKHSVLLSGHRTSISLEQPFWIKLKEISKLRGKSMNQQITEIDNERFKTSKKKLIKRNTSLCIGENQSIVRQHYNK